MLRFLQILLALLAVRVIWGAIRSFANRRPREFSSASPKAPGGAERRGAVVGCDRCDLHVPEERAVRRGGRTFCSDDCAAAAAGA